jgi:hypothetical protein
MMSGSLRATPFWAMTTSALDAFVIWALAVHGREITALTDRHKHSLVEPGRCLAVLGARVTPECDRRQVGWMPSR